MEKKHKRKRWRTAPIFIFTLASLSITQEAMSFFEQFLARSNHQLANMPFAYETTQRIKKKLDLMHQSMGSVSLIAFDSNEKILLVTAIQLYMLELPSGPLTAEQQQKLRICQQIEQSMLEQMNMPFPTHD